MRFTSIAVAVSLVATSGLSARDRAPNRKPLDSRQIEALVSLLDAVDRVERAEQPVDAGGLHLDAQVLKGRRLAYVPFRVGLGEDAGDAYRSVGVYIRAVARTDGAPDQHSRIRDALLHTTSSRPVEAGDVNVGEMPVGGPAGMSVRSSIRSANESSTALRLQTMAAEKESKRDPRLFAYEDYEFFEPKASDGEPRAIERALALPPGAYDLYVAVADRARPKDAPVPRVVKQALVVPDFWNDELALSSLVLTRGVEQMKKALTPDQQHEHPYAFGLVDVQPLTGRSFTQDDALSVVFQICNYASPNAEMSAEFEFYQIVDGHRRFFNRTAPQQFEDADLPPPPAAETFAMQSVPLASFPPGRYELDVVVTDFTKVNMARASVGFMVAAR